MEASEQDKSEQPTVFKLTRAREKGTVARGQDLGFLTGLGAFVGFCWVAGPQLVGAISNAYRGALIEGTDLSDGQGALLAATVRIFTYILGPVALMAGTVFFIVLLFEIVQTGFVFSAQPLTPDFSRLNPATGLKRVFSLRLLIETLKNIVKLGVYTTVAYLVIGGAFAGAHSIFDARSLFDHMAQIGLRLIAAFILGAVLFAAIDQLIVRRDFFKKMRMSRREVRREARDREGEPRLKQRRKQLHAEFAKSSQSLRNVRKSDVLVTNPEHIAMGLRYEATKMSAPTIVAVGTNHLAQRLKRLAFIYGIPVIENRALARELYRSASLNSPVPEKCFRQVADIYIVLRNRACAQNSEEVHD